MNEGRFGHGTTPAIPMLFHPSNTSNRFAISMDMAIARGLAQMQTPMTNGAFHGFLFADGELGPPFLQERLELDHPGHYLFDAGVVLRRLP